MATAESVKDKLQGLIDTANAKTGKSEVTLTSAVNALVDGYGKGSSLPTDEKNQVIQDALNVALGGKY